MQASHYERLRSALNAFDIAKAERLARRLDNPSTFSVTLPEGVDPHQPLPVFCGEPGSGTMVEIMLPHGPGVRAGDEVFFELPADAARHDEEADLYATAGDLIHTLRSVLAEAETS